MTNTGKILILLLMLFSVSLPVNADQPIEPNPNNGTIVVSEDDWNDLHFVNNGTLNITGSGTLCNNSGATLTSNGTLCNAGALCNEGTLINQAGGIVANTGTFLNDVSSILTNSGTLRNSNWLVNMNGSSFTNNGTVIHDPGATLENQDDSVVTNNGTLINNGLLGNDDSDSVLINNGTLGNNSTLVNFGTFTNNGALSNNAGATLSNNGALKNLVGGTLNNWGTFANNGTFTNNGAFANYGILTGTGTIVGNITNSGIVAPGNLVGTMTITGNYTHNAVATYQVEVDNSGQSDRLVVTGTATLNGGTVSLQTKSGIYFMNTAYTILSAGSVAGTFANVTSDLAFLTPSLGYDPTHVYLLLTRNSTSFADVAETENQRAAASALDRVSSGATGDMDTVIDNLLSLSASGARGAYDQMGGLVHTTLPGATFSSFNRYINTMTGRMVGFITGAPSSMFAGQPVMLASRADMGSDAGNALLTSLARAGKKDAPSWGLWVQGYGSTGDRRGSDISSRYDYNMAGAIVGFDRKITTSLLLGASLGYSHTTVDMKDLSDTATVSGYQGSLYGIYKSGPWYVSSAAAYGYNRYDTRRDISFGSITRRANAAYSGHTLGGYLEGGIRVTTVHLDIIPTASLTGNYLTRDGFRESDAGALNLDADGEHASSLVGSLGVRLTKSYTAASGTVTPEVRIRWNHEFMNDDYTLNGSFTGYPLSAFTVRGDRPDRDSASLGMGITWQAKENLYFNLSYDGSFSTDQTQHGGTMGIRYRW